MRTNEEIVGRVKALEGLGRDLDGRRGLRLVCLLPFDAAKAFLTPEATAENWKPVKQSDLPTHVRRDLKFAWGKSLDHRGISASLMSTVMKDWVWVLLDDEQSRRIEGAPYQNYGAPVLALAAELLDIHEPLSEREEAIRMAQGLPCREGCDEGCGR